MTQQLQQLLNQAHTLLDQVLNDPQYQTLLKRGFTPESTIFNAQRLIASLDLEIKDFTEKSMVEQLVDVIANARLEASEKIAEYIVSETERQDVSLSDLLFGFAQVAFNRGLEESAKFLENASEKCRA
ncbi:hypothetical protein [Nostoc sp. PA-18-2419]|uniref:hypothetical protein n=1 Tax=Nostoc sp. PA-18-2419 TaxID=2575443 RepID=UPI0011080B83|nr:hypothetical protein [Nostoc sp. PA-18-2419]